MERSYYVYIVFVGAGGSLPLGFSLHEIQRLVSAEGFYDNRQWKNRYSVNNKKNTSATSCTNWITIVQQPLKF